jgi:hypothetical protein
MFHSGTVLHMYSASICVFPEESSDDGLSRPKHVVVIKNICLCDSNYFNFTELLTCLNITP